MVRDRAGRAACHRLLEHPQAPLCLGPPAASSQPASPRYRGNAKSRIDLADAPLRLLATFDDQITRRAVAATAWNNRLTEGQTNRLRAKTPDVCQGQIALLGQRLLPAA